LPACLAYCLTPEMKAEYSFKTLLNFWWTVQYHIPEDCIFCSHDCENLKSNQYCLMS
jgi:hypothetical protein